MVGARSGAPSQRRWAQAANRAALARGNDDDARLDRGTVADGEQDPPGAFVVLAATRRDGEIGVNTKNRHL